MPVTPKQVQSSVNYEPANQWMKEADEQLLKTYSPNGEYTLYPPRDLLSFIGYIKESYEKVGWHVEFYSDQRDGAWLTLRTPEAQKERNALADSYWDNH